MILLTVFFQEFSLEEKLLNELQTVFSFEVKSVHSKMPAATKRGSQFEADDFLPLLESLKGKEQADFVLALTARDLFSGSLNFVFGLANPFAKTCIVSCHRLKSPDSEKFFHRTLKESIHEIGHLLSLSHCPNKKCVMSLSNSLTEADYKESEFCEKCKKKVKKAIE